MLQPQRKVFVIEPPPVPVLNKILIPVDRPNEYYGQEEVIGYVIQYPISLYCIFVIFNGIVDVSKYIVRHPDRYSPIVANGKQYLGG
jgi:hypothetical protein